MRVVVMGVTGSGKSTVGKAVAEAFGFEFADGDDFHPAANVAKMADGTPLTDEDRWPWLDAVGAWLAQRDGAVAACSALKRVYRDRLREAAPGIVFVHLAAPQDVLEERVARRHVEEGHFATPGLLTSQFEALEPLAMDEVGGVVDVATASVPEACQAAIDIVAAVEG
ncbi:MAG: gluconokinase [Actinomycetes bacterium]|nr:MAG: gluconate kinase [Actinomycetota bacterium]